MAHNYHPLLDINGNLPVGARECAEPIDVARIQQERREKLELKQRVRQLEALVDDLIKRVDPALLTVHIPSDERCGFKGCKKRKYHSGNCDRSHTPWEQ